MTSRRPSPFELIVLRDAILRRAATRHFEKEFADLDQSHDLTGGGLKPSHYPALYVTFSRGALFELERLSNATGVDLRSLSAKAMADGAKNWVSAVKRDARFDTCNPDSWRNVLINSFEAGAEWVARTLWPDPPPRRKVPSR